MADNTEVDIENSLLGKLKISGGTGFIILVLTFVGVCLLVYMFYQHSADAAVRDNTMAGVLTKLVGAQEEANRIHRETNCLIGYQGPPTEKQSFCKQVTR